MDDTAICTIDEPSMETITVDGDSELPPRTLLCDWSSPELRLYYGTLGIF